MTVTELLPWLSGLSLVIAIGTAFWNFFQSPAARLERNTTTALSKLEEDTRGKLTRLETDTTAEVDQLDRRLDAAEARLGKVEVEMQHMPTRDGAHRLELAVSELNGKMSVLDERLKPVTAIAERMQEMMLAGKN
jgi:hypothetical protein